MTPLHKPGIFIFLSPETRLLDRLRLFLHEHLETRVTDNGIAYNLNATLDDLILLATLKNLSSLGQGSIRSCSVKLESSA